MDRVSFLIIALPLAAGIINSLFSKIINRTYAGFIACSAMTIACCCAGKIFYQILTTEILVHNIIAEWFQLGTNIVSWSIYIDQLTSIMILVITLVSSIVHIYSLGYMEKDENLPKFLSYLSFFTFFMLALVSADNLVQLFFGWEGVGLCSYLLIGYWYKKESANNAAIKAFIVNRVGDFAFIIGIILIFIYTGQVDFAGIFVQAKDLASLKLSIIGTKFSVLDLICFLLFIGCMGKSAQIGLHIWLPDAMEGPTPVSALIHAATMVTAGIFLVARCSYLFEYSPHILQFIAIVGGITCLFAATIAITQSDIKKIIAYSTCSQLGYMFLACGVSAYQAGIFHLVTHAFFKALLFLSAGSVIHACHEQDIFKMGGLKNKMPFTYLNFWIGSLAIIGIFPLAGFYSKDLILESAYNANFVGKIVFSLGIVAAILTAIYSLKIILLVFHGESKLEPDKFEKIHEAPAIMNLPLILLIIGSIFAGMIGYYKLRIGSFGGYFANSIYNLHINNHEEHISFLIKFFPMIAGVIGILIAYSLYKDELYKAIATRAKTLYKIFNNKYYFDELYETLLINPIKHISRVANMFDFKVIDRFGPKELVRASNKIGAIISHLHSGYIFNYNLIILLAIVVYITYFIINFIKIL